MKFIAEQRVTNRKGMTLIEVMMAITILAIATMSIAGFMGKFTRIVALSDVKNTANELASQRLEQIKNAPRYSAIDTLYPGTQALGVPYVGYNRQTLVTHTGGGPSDLYDYKTVTVIVSNSRIATPIKRTTMIAAF
ncbi:MAG: prepilin-type N-terminal cleavage/methylation domain-containing protein [Gemmatimonadota bacterium]|nr:prepilin-type N-terminal cleavage/methylation domain-containing protein [Gemmatimonadota bacterium]